MEAPGECFASLAWCVRTPSHGVSLGRARAVPRTLGLLGPRTCQKAFARLMCWANGWQISAATAEGEEFADQAQDQLGPAAEFQLRVQVPGKRVNGMRRNVQTSSDPSFFVVVENCPHDLKFAGREI